MFSYFSKKSNKHSGDSLKTCDKSSDRNIGDRKSNSECKPEDDNELDMDVQILGSEESNSQQISEKAQCTSIIPMKSRLKLDVSILDKYAPIGSDGYLMKSIGESENYNLFF